jgi:hypothetical protein
MTYQTPQSTKERFKVTGSQLLDRVKQILHAGNVRRIVISQEGRPIAEFPLTVGVVGAVFAPVLAAIGALAALLSECTIEIERVEDAPAPRHGDVPEASAALPPANDKAAAE